MKETVIDVLMFLFDNYLDFEEGVSEDEASLTWELEEAGFHVKDITKAFDWLETLAEIKNAKPLMMPMARNSMRVYLPQEIAKLDLACRGFLVQLEEMKLLDTSTREIIIERSTAIEVEQLNLKQFKRIVGLVMMNQPGYEEISHWIEELVYSEENEQAIIH